ncbi:hypothetical protein [Limosilactobacillus fermentum]
MYNQTMEINEKLFKALANQTRLDILRWLKEPAHPYRRRNL